MRVRALAAVACLVLAACAASGAAPVSGEAERSALLHPFAGKQPRTARSVRDSLSASAVTPAPAIVAEMPAPDPGAALDRPLTCLAHTVYWEAKSEGEVGMRAVAHVVLNRAAAAGFPGDVCAVVKQGGPEAPCQFGWYCDGRDDAPDNAAQYAAAHRIAWEALEGRSSDPTAGATMFHGAHSHPKWVARARRTKQIGNHVFYRLG